MASAIGLVRHLYLSVVRVGSPHPHFPAVAGAFPHELGGGRLRFLSVNADGERPPDLIPTLWGDPNGRHLCTAWPPFSVKNASHMSKVTPVAQPVWRSGRA